MRGKGKARHNRGTDFGITPAYAGKSTRGVAPRLIARGSPPPMRGKGGNDCHQEASSRITPAYAGKSLL